MLASVILALIALTNGQRTLETYNVDLSQISVSGFSSGGGFAFQYHVGFSSEVMGTGCYSAGGPPMCVLTGYPMMDCALLPEGIDIPQLWNLTETHAALGNIDPPINMQNDRVYIFFGTLDTLVDVGGAVVNEEYYKHYLPEANIHRYDTLACEHAVPSCTRGLPCPELYGGFGYINDCSYDGAFETLDWMYGGLQRPVYNGVVGPPLIGDFYAFDQNEFLDETDPANEPWDPQGYIYVPSGCMDKQTTCRFHIMFHGCDLGRYKMNDTFAYNNGYSEVGELNNIIILFPQVKPSVNDPVGCWDWMGYFGLDMVYKTGHLMQATKKTMDRVTGLNPVKKI